MAALTLTACQQADLSEEAVQQEQQQKTKHFTFHVKGDFKMEYADMSRASVRLEDDNTAGITDIWVLDYVTVPGESSPVLMQQVHQTSTDTDFGHPSLDLSYGSHDIKLIASKGDTPVLSASALSWAKVKDTFVLDYPVNVVASSNGNRAPELKRAISGLQIAMQDAVPENVATVKVKLSKHYKTLLLSTLLADTDAEFENTFTFTSTHVGQKITLNTYTLCPTSDAWTTDVTVTSLDKNNATLSTFTVQDVELKQNRITTLKGEIFSRGSGFSVTIDDTWLDPTEIEF